MCYDPGVSIAPEFVDIGSLIDQREGYRGGRPFIVGTGVTVDRISVLLNVDHLSPEEIADAANLSLAQVHAALTFILPTLSPSMRSWTGSLRSTGD